MYFIYLFVAVLYISDLQMCTYKTCEIHIFLETVWFYLRRNLNFPRCLIFVLKINATSREHYIAQP
jgi:hypothetical protein